MSVGHDDGPGPRAGDEEEDTTVSSDTAGHPEGTTGALEAMGTARVMRWLRPDPVPDEVVDQLLWAATRASSPHNCQPWEFVVVRRDDLRAGIAAAVAGAVHAKDPLPEPESRTDEIIDRGVRNMFEHMGDAPVMILVCGRNVYPPQAPIERFLVGALAAATQNLVVAARALGVGVVPSGFHSLAEPRIRALLGIPDDVSIGTTVVVGWPARPFGPVHRRPVDEVVHVDGW
jgi:nitroreductase